MSKTVKTNENIKIKEVVYQMVKNIPKGKVETYGSIANNLNLKRQSRAINFKINPRYVGYLLHKNPDPKNTPCHRVVNVKGMLADNYKFGGWREQKKKLIGEGVKFISEKKVDIKRYMN